MAERAPPQLLGEHGELLEGHVQIRNPETERFGRGARLLQRGLQLLPGSREPRLERDHFAAHELPRPASQLLRSFGNGEIHQASLGGGRQHSEAAAASSRLGWAPCSCGSSRGRLDRLYERRHGLQTEMLPRILLFAARSGERSEEHTSELQSRLHLVCRLLLEKKKKKQ